MEQEFIWVTTDEKPVGEATRDFNDAVRGVLPKRVPVRAEALEQNMAEFLRVVGRVLNQAQKQAGDVAGMELEEIEISVEINGEGEVSLLGTGGKVGAKGSMMLKFKRTGT